MSMKWGIFCRLQSKQGSAKRSRHIMNTQNAATQKEYGPKFDGEAPDSDAIQLPSALQPNQVAKLQFREKDEPLTATVRGVHFYPGKVKYDLGLWLGDGSVDDPERESRIYNVDSAFVSPA